MKSNAIAKVSPIATPKVSKVAESVKVSPKALNSHTQGKAQYAELMSRPYGTEGHTFGDAIDHAASSYVGILRQKKNILGKRSASLILQWNLHRVAKPLLRIQKRMIRPVTKLRQ